MIADQTFTHISQLPPGEHFVSCRFIGAQLMQADASGRTFEDCSFEDCDLSMLNVKSTSFKTTRFLRCKLQGISFFEASHFLFSPVFMECQMDMTSFAGMTLKKMIFKQCSLRAAAFSNANLTGADFTNCDLTRAVFLHTTLDKADLSTAHSFVIDPDANSLNQTHFSLYGLPGLLEKYNIRVSEIDG